MPPTIELEVSSPEAEASLRKLIGASGAGSMEELFLGSLDLFSWAVEEVVAGRSITSVSSDQESSAGVKLCELAVLKRIPPKAL